MQMLHLGGFVSVFVFVCVTGGNPVISSSPTLLFCNILLLGLLNMKHLFCWQRSNFSVFNFGMNVLLPYSRYCFPYFLPYQNCLSSTPPIWVFFNRVVIEMYLASIIFKEIRCGWIRKYQVLLFFMLRQLKTTDSLRNSDELVWNFALFQKQIFVEVLKTASTKHFLKILWNLQRKI